MSHFYDRKHIGVLLLVVILMLPLADVMAGSSKKKRKKQQHQAENYFDKGDYYHALLIFEELIKDDPSSKYFNYHVGVCKFHLKHYHSESLSYLEKADESVDTEIYYYLGMLYHQNLQFEKAAKAFRDYLAVEVRVHETRYVNQLLENISTAKKYYGSSSLVEINNLGNTINTAYSEYVPLITADGTKMFFTSRRPGSTGNLTDVLGNYFEDIYATTKQGDVWNAPEQLPAPLNTETHDACVGLTPEGDNLLFFRTNLEQTSGDIFMSESDGKTWNTPVLLDPIINDPQWNEPSACYSPDGESIYFTSNRPGGFGGKDIYRSVKLPNGKWSLAMNLGPNINTEFDEDAPFVHSTGDEFYFSSMGHQNLGGYDVFKSVMDSTGNWSAPSNLGHPINTVEDDIYLVLSADGQTGYLSSARAGGFGETDIYSFVFTTMDPGYMVAEGYVKNSKGEPLAAKITVIETDMMKIHGIYKSNRLSGKFVYLFCEDHLYEIVVEAEGYYSQTVYLTGGELDKLEVELKSVKE